MTLVLTGSKSMGGLSLHDTNVEVIRIGLKSILKEASICGPFDVLSKLKSRDGLLSEELRFDSKSDKLILSASDDFGLKISEIHT